MKKTDEKFDLYELLRTVEHAGRDNRRQQQLSDLIDSLAAEEESAHRKVLWRRWSIGISVAACLVLFVTTIVKFTAQDAIQPSGSLVAEAQADTAAKPMLVEINDDDSPSLGERTVRPHTVSPAIAPQRVAEQSDDRQVVKEMDEAFTEEVIPVDVYDNDVQYAEQIEQRKSEDTLLEHVDADSDNVQMQPQFAMQEPTAKREKAPRKWFKLRRANPSKMDGTVLAFNLL